MRIPYPCLLLGLLALTILAPRPAPAQAPAQKEPPYKRVLIGDDARHVAELEQKVGQLRAAGQFAESVAPAEQLAAIRERAQGADHWEVADARRRAQTLKRLAALPTEEQQAFASAIRANQEAFQLQARGKYAEAQLLFEKALTIYQQTLGERHADTAVIQDNVGYTLTAQAKYVQAQLLHEKALATRCRVLGEDHPDTALGYSNLATNLNGQGKYAEAQPLFEKALAILHHVLGEAHPYTAQAHNNLAGNLQAQAKYAEAQPLFEKALALWRQGLGDGHRLTGNGYNNVAYNLHLQGKYAEARPLFEKALAIRRRVLGEEHPDTAAVYNNLALNLQAQGSYVEAQPLFEKALAVWRQTLGEGHPFTAHGYNNLALNLQAQGKYAEAQPLFEKALVIRRQALGEVHSDTALSCNNLALNLSFQRRYAEAQPLYENAVAIWDQALPKGHPLTGRGRNNLAANLRAQGKYAEAQPVLEQALTILRQGLGEGHPDTASVCINVASNLHAQGKYAEAEERATEAARGYEAARLSLSFAGLERATFASERSPLPLLAALLARKGKPAEAWRRLEEGLARGLLDDLAARQGRPLSEKERRREEELVGRLQLLDRQLTALLAGQERAEARRKQVAWLHDARGEAQRQLDEQEAELARKYGPVAGQVHDLARVQARLPEDAALLAWLDVPDLPRTADPRGEHWACVLRRRGEPAWVRLPGSGPGGAWTEADARLAAEVGDPVAERPRDITAGWQEAARQLDRQRLAPLAGRLEAGDGLPAVRHLIVLPSPAMTGVPVEVLLAARPTDQPALTINYAPSATLFAWVRERHRNAMAAAGPGRLLSLGDPAFPMPPAGRDAPLVAARGEGLVPLPGTRREVEAIARLFPQADTLLGSDASEQRLDQLAEEGRLRQYRYLHLATHGFIDPAQPMRSFLALAQDSLPDPVEQVLHGRPAYSGRLTAADILRRWKLDADLVTLSACRSGLGKYELGEGYVGFAQGLLLAGAHSVVLSEWSVDDDATALLMTRFYQNLLGKRPRLDHPMPKAEALREAKEWLRNLSAAEAGEGLAALPRGRLEAKRPAPAGPRPYAHPYYWAAFLLVGDPG
jgi:CHAT domain-containing protein/Tfp pilus assembly protein PilF